MTVKSSAMMVAAATATFWTLAAPISAPMATADSGETVTTTLGQPAEIANGAVKQAWTITALKPSSDVIPHAVQGTLWEAAAADTALQGDVTPIVPNLSARSADGTTYRVLWTVATPQGVNPATLTAGQTTAGKIFFDVTGPSPDSVLYSDGAREVALWLQPPPQPAASGSGGSATAASPSGAGATGLAESGDVAPVPVGSQGTPLPVGSQGTPATADAAEGTPAAAAAADAAEGTPAAASEGTPAAAAPAGSQGTPVAGTPAPATSQGTAAATPTPAEGTQNATAEGAPATPATPVVPHGGS